MSLQNQPQPEIPEATARIVRAAFKKGNIYLKIRDSLGVIRAFFWTLFRRRLTNDKRMALMISSYGLHGNTKEWFLFGDDLEIGHLSWTGDHHQKRLFKHLR